MITPENGKARAAERSRPVQVNNYPFWSPRFWHGMRFRAWLRLLSRHRYAVHPMRLPMALIVTIISLFNSLLYRISNWLYARAVAETVIEHPPLFIIGHWRSGTTYLHELLVRDERFAYPTTYECFAPSHFLLTGKWFPRLLFFLLPSKRPMDNMPAGFHHPQEDEFALCAMGVPTPYYRMAFPHHEPPYMEFLDMQGVAADDLRRWKEAMLFFVRALTYAKRKRIVLKSPPHTGRIEVLAELFPGAKFLHIVRDPQAIFASTQKLWPALDAAQSFQWPTPSDLDDYVYAAFERMYRGFDRQRSSIPATDLCDVRYEDLVKDPVGELEAVYRKLDLGDFEVMRPKLEAFVQSQQGYRVNKNQLDPATQAEVRRRWGFYAERYGYQDPEADRLRTPAPVADAPGA